MKRDKDILILRAAAGDRDAELQMLADYKPLLWKMSRKYKATDEEIEDTVQKATMALIEAARRFNPNNATGAHFFTYAHSWIRGRLLTAIKKDHLMHVPAHYDRRDEQWAKYANPISLDEPGNDDNGTLADTVPDRDSAHDIASEVDRQQRIRHVQVCLGKMHERDRAILMQRVSGLKLLEVGRNFGVTRERIRQIENRALERLEKLLQSVPIMDIELHQKPNEASMNGNGTGMGLPSGTIFEALEKATDQDIQAVELDLEVLAGRIAKLKSLRKILIGLVRGKQKRGPRQPRTPSPFSVQQGSRVSASKAAEMLARRTKIARTILDAGKPLSESDICNAIGLSKSHFMCVREHPWFKNTDGGWTVTAEGKKEAKAAAA